jgi:GT2 family glycosyltransferase
MKKINVSIIYVYYNTPREILDSIESLKEAAKGLMYEVIVLNNNSPKPPPSGLYKNKLINVLENSKNVGFGAGANKAVRSAKGEYLFVLNPDTICNKNSIKLLFDRAKNDKKIGVLGPQQIDKNGKILHSIGSMPKLPDALFALSFLNKIWPGNPYSNKYWAKGVNRNAEQETETVGGACMLFPKKIFDKVGGFDERFFMYFEEADICWRIKTAGYKILYYPEAKIIHLIGGSTSNKKWIRKTFEESRFKFFQKYYGTPIALISELFFRISSTFSPL